MLLELFNMKYIFLYVIYITILANNAIYKYSGQDGVIVLSNKPKEANLDKRIKILKEELHSESLALSNEIKMLNDNKYIKEFKSRQLLLESIETHKNNIQILTKQIGVITN